MDTIRKLRIGYWIVEIGRRLHAPISPIQTLLILLFTLPLVSSCISTRPVAKIGLLAPFEGVYRQEGYDALTAMRAALAEQIVPGVDVLPLALDSSRDVERSAQKILADPSVVAIVGPYWAADGSALGSLVDGEKWLHPYAPTGDERWAVAAVEKAHAFAQAQNRILTLAGESSDWPNLNFKWAAGPEDVGDEDVLFWLGDAAEGAEFALAVWQRLPATPIGLYGAGIESFRQRVEKRVIGPLFLVGWIDDDYAVWAKSHSPATPATYTVYRQTADTLQHLAGETVTTAWQPGLFILNDLGQLSLSSVD